MSTPTEELDVEEGTVGFELPVPWDEEPMG